MAMAKKAVALPKTDAVKAETTVSAKAEEVKKEAAAKTEAPVKKETVKRVRKAAAPKKETAAKKTAAPKKAASPRKAGAGRKAVKSEIHIQFSGKSYSNEDLIKIAKDVWKYDLQQNESDIADLELYVKPEENLVYYVINGEYSGSFGIESGHRRMLF